MDVEAWGDAGTHDRVGSSEDDALLIQRNDPSLKNVAITLSRDPPQDGEIIPDAKIREFGEGIGNNTHLRYLRIFGEGGRESADEGTERFQLLCTGINKNQSIKKFSLFGVNFGGDEFRLLNPFLLNNNNLQSITLGNGLNREGMRWLLTALMRRNNPLDKFNLSDNSTNGYLVEELLMTLIENPALTPKLVVLRLNTLSQNGCRSIGRILQDARCSMEEINLAVTQIINDDAAFCFADALVTNTTLRSMHLYQLGITTTGLGAICRSLFNTASINSTYSSNHTLQDFFSRGIFRSTALDECLEWNRSMNKKQVARCKIFMQHFIRNFKMEPFKEMKSDLLLRVVTFVEKASAENGGVRNEDACNSIIFQLLKNDPSICDGKKFGTVENDNPCKRRRL